MSALENAVRVNSDKQTLILAGEPIPRRSVSESLAGGRGLSYPDSQRPLTLVATPVDDPVLLLQSGSEPIGTELTPLSRNLVSHRSSDRGNPYSAANAYARTQELSGGSQRSVLIDTYA